MSRRCRANNNYLVRRFAQMHDDVVFIVNHWSHQPISHKRNRTLAAPNDGEMHDNQRAPRIWDQPISLVLKNGRWYAEPNIEAFTRTKEAHMHTHMQRSSPHWQAPLTTTTTTQRVTVTHRIIKRSHVQAPPALTKYIPDTRSSDAIHASSSRLSRPSP